MRKNCSTCGTPMSLNRFKENDCPHCNTENFVGFNHVPNEPSLEIKKSLNLDVVDNPDFVEKHKNETVVEIE